MGYTKLIVMIWTLIAFSVLAMFGKMTPDVMGIVGGLATAYFLFRYQDHKMLIGEGIGTKFVSVMVGITLITVLHIVGKSTIWLDAGIAGVIATYCGFRFQDHIQPAAPEEPVAPQ